MDVTHSESTSQSSSPPISGPQPDALRPRLGLMLGAGGIRGSAHAGVLSVLEELGLQAEVVVGASIGALFGAAYSAGWEAQRIRRLSDQAPLGSVAEFYRNRLRIDGSTYIGRIMEALGRRTRIEELPLRFACMALDCSSGKVTAIQEGFLLEALEASIALPGIARPVTIGEATYLDGGLRGPMSASVARALGADVVIHVELSTVNLVRAGLRHSLRAVGTATWAWIGRASRPRGPALLKAANRDTAPCAQNVADLVIAPEFYGLFRNSPMGVRFCVRQGERAARRSLEPVAVAQLGLA